MTILRSTCHDATGSIWTWSCGRFGLHKALRATGLQFEPLVVEAHGGLARTLDECAGSCHARGPRETRSRARPRLSGKPLWYLRVISTPPRSGLGLPAATLTGRPRCAASAIEERPAQPHMRMVPSQVGSTLSHSLSPVSAGRSAPGLCPHAGACLAGRRRWRAATGGHPAFVSAASRPL